MAVPGQGLQRHDGPARGASACSPTTRSSSGRTCSRQRSAWLNLQGTPYFYVIAPDTHAVYADKLPDDVVPGATRPALQVLDHLRERDSFAPVLYPLEELIAERDELVYPKTGSHWSEFGAFVGYRALMKRDDRDPAGAQAHRTASSTCPTRSAPATWGSSSTPPQKSRYVYVDVIGARTRHERQPVPQPRPPRRVRVRRVQRAHVPGVRRLVRGAHDAADRGGLLAHLLGTCVLRLRAHPRAAAGRRRDGGGRARHDRPAERHGAGPPPPRGAQAGHRRPAAAPRLEGRAHQQPARLPGVAPSAASDAAAADG